jgi:hypothetical protein
LHTPFSLYPEVALKRESLYHTLVPPLLEQTLPLAWRGSLRELELPHLPFGHTRQGDMAFAVMGALMQLPALEVFAPGPVWEGLVIGLIEAREAGAATRLREVDFANRRYGMMERAGLLLLAWMKHEANGLATFEVKNLSICGVVIRELSKQIGLRMFKDG